MIAIAQIALALATAPVTSPAIATDLSHEARWAWSGSANDRRPLIIRLVRGSISVVRRPGPVEISIRAVSKSSPAVRYDLEAGAEAITVTDRYPPAARWSRSECLPPMDQRGNFWDSDVRAEARISAPVGVVVDAHVMEQGGDFP